MVNSLNGGAAVHTVLTELDDQKFFSRGMALIKSTASYIFIYFFIYIYFHIFIYFHFFKSITKVFQTSYLQNEAVNELNDNFICREATRVSLNLTMLSYS